MAVLNERQGTSGDWHEVVQSAPKRTPRWYRQLAGRAIPPIIVAFVLVRLQRPGLAVAVLVAALVLGVTSALSPAVDRAVARALHLVGHVVGRALTFVLLGLVAVVVLVPVAVVGAIVNRHPREGVAATGRWIERPSHRRGLPRRLYAMESTALDPRAGWRLAVEAFGWITVIVLLDLAAGWLWSNTLTPYDAAARAVSTPADASTTDPSGRASHIAMQGSPWAAGYYEEFDALEYEFEPFITTRMQDHQGRYINIADGIRRSYAAEDLAPDAPTVWFFGGSTTWGEDQRDQHTIPSEVARIAEAAGTPIRVVNFGVNGFVLWQEVLRFERALAADDAPDLAVFYDGINDLLTQVEDQEPGQPTIYNASDYTARLSYQAPLLGTDGEPVADLREAVWLWWREHSALARLTERVQAEFAPAPAGAQEVSFTTEDMNDALPETVDVYLRGRALLLDIAERHGVETLLTWQADLSAAESDSDDAPLERAAELIGEPTVDLTNAFDSLDREDLYTVFTDGGHTNERGARVVAETLWPLIDAALGAKAEANER